MQQDLNRTNLRRLTEALARRGVWIVVCVVVAAGAAFGVSRLEAKQYTATASLLFKSNDFSQQIAGLPTNVTSQAEQKNNLRLVQFSNVAAKTASALGRGVSERQVTESVSVAEVGESAFAGESNVVEVSASSKSPALSTAIANTYAEQFVAQQRAADRQYYESALALVAKQLKAIPARQRFSTAAVALQTRAQSLRLLAELQSGAVQIGRSASAPTSPSSPKTSRNVLVGALLGLLAGLGLAFLLEHLDRRVRDPDDLAASYGAPLLGVVREDSSLSAGRDSETTLPESEAESFGLLLAHLRSFNADRSVRAVVVTSAAPGEGKTTIALHLAEAAARSGSRALLLEVNLRRPTIATRLGVQATPGLVDVLTDVIPLEEGIQSIEISARDDLSRAGRKLDVLAAGERGSTDPTRLFESYAIEVMLAQAQATYDFVVMDAPPLAVVPDAFPLLRHADGVVIVGAIGRSRADVGERLRHILGSSRVPLLGVVANRVRARARSAYAPPGPDTSAAAVVPPTVSQREGSQRAARA